VTVAASWIKAHYGVVDRAPDLPFNITSPLSTKNSKN